jgi:hypothetical protein
MAPGTYIRTTDRQGSYTWFNGTSAACPHVAAVAGLVLSINPNLKVLQVNDIIEQSAQKVRTDLYTYQYTGDRPNGTWNQEIGYGLVNAANAVYLAKSIPLLLPTFNPCWADFTVISNVLPSNIDNKQASNTITASNKLYSTAKGSYHAGNAVILQPGFYAEFGSVFNAYIESCSGNFKSLDDIAGADNEVEENIKSISEDVAKDFSIYVYPNPSKGLFTVNFSDDSPKSIKIVDGLGKLVFSKDNATGNLLNIDLSNNSQGIYYLNVISNNNKAGKLILLE